MDTLDHRSRRQASARGFKLGLKPPLTIWSRRFHKLSNASASFNVLQRLNLLQRGSGCTRSPRSLSWAAPLASSMRRMDFTDPPPSLANHRVCTHTTRARVTHAPQAVKASWYGEHPAQLRLGLWVACVSVVQWGNACYASHCMHHVGTSSALMSELVSSVHQSM